MSHICPTCGQKVPEELFNQLKEGKSAWCEFCGADLTDLVGEEKTPKRKSIDSEQPFDTQGVPIREATPDDFLAIFQKKQTAYQKLFSARKHAFLTLLCDGCGRDFHTEIVEGSIRSEKSEIVCPYCGTVVNREKFLAGGKFTFEKF